MLNSCILNPKVDPLSSHSCYCALDATTSGIKGSHTPVRGFICSVLSLQHESCVLQAMTERCGNFATRLQVGQHEAQSMKLEVTMQYTLAVNFASGVGPCTGIFEPFKHLLRVTAHPQFWHLLGTIWYMYVVIVISVHYWGHPPACSSLCRGMRNNVEGPCDAHCLPPPKDHHLLTCMTRTFPAVSL